MRFKLIVCFPIFWLALLKLTAQDQTDKLDTPPYFKGCAAEHSKKEVMKKCSDEKMMQFVAKNLKYPSAAVEGNLQGVVIVGFEIDKSGNIANASVLRDIGLGCGNAALEVVNSMPQWSPAMFAKEPVRFKMQLPIRFALDNDRPDDSGYTIHWGKNTDKNIKKEELEQLLATSPIMVRDDFGNSVAFEQLKITIEKGRKVYSEISADNTITPKMKKIIKKAKPGSTFILTIQVKKDAKIIPVERIYDIK